MKDLYLVFTESQHVVEFSQVRKFIPTCQKWGISGYVVASFISYHLKTILIEFSFRTYLRGTFSSSCHSWKKTSLQIWKKLQELFTERLTSWNLSFFVCMPPISTKGFLIFKELCKNKRVMAAMPIIIEWLNVNLNSGFVNF